MQKVEIRIGIGLARPASFHPYFDQMGVSFIQYNLETWVTIKKQIDSFLVFLYFDRFYEKSLGKVVPGIWKFSTASLLPYSENLGLPRLSRFTVVCVCVCVCVCVRVCVCISFHRKGFSSLKQNNNNKCNARDQASDVVLRKLLSVKHLRRHVIDNHGMDLQPSNCAVVSIKPGRATGSKRQLLKLSKNQR